MIIYKKGNVHGVESLPNSGIKNPEPISTVLPENPEVDIKVEPSESENVPTETDSKGHVHEVESIPSSSIKKFESSSTVLPENPEVDINVEPTESENVPAKTDSKEAIEINNETLDQEGTQEIIAYVEDDETVSTLNTDDAEIKESENVSEEMEDTKAALEENTFGTCGPCDKVFENSVEYISHIESFHQEGSIEENVTLSEKNQETLSEKKSEDSDEIKASEKVNKSEDVAENFDLAKNDMKTNSEKVSEPKNDKPPKSKATKFRTRSSKKKISQ